MNKKLCKNCQFYLQHFVFDQRKILRVHCGHCTISRPKRKLPDSTACQNYTPGTAPEDAFVSKEYLNKELLRYMLSLELLPKIEENK